MALRYAAQLMPEADSLPSRRRESFPEIEDERFWNLYRIASPYSLVHVPGFYNVYQTMNYIARNGIEGDLVECGCFLGGMSIFITLLRDALGLPRTVYLFDTFTGFPPGSEDVCLGTPQVGIQVEHFLESVKANFMDAVGHTRGVEFVEGPVEDTAAASPIASISLLRLDTDFYPSTRAELESFYPKLSRGGALIIDDYGLFQGSRRATDEYFARSQAAPLLNRIDPGIWAGVKP